jgi:3-oxoacyl-[acyl-carrier protein] reductase
MIIDTGKHNIETNLHSLHGRVVIVTGGVGGLGRAYCRGFASRGARVVVADLAAVDAFVDELRDLGADAMAVEVDISDLASTIEMAKQTVDRFGRIDVLVNNAAYYIQAMHGAYDEIGVAEWDKCFAVNVRGTWLCTRAVVPNMIENGGGRVVNVASMTVVDGTIGFPHYVASKAAVIGLTRSLARELGPYAIAVNTVTPDYIPHDKEYADLQPGVDAFIVNKRCFKRTQTPDDMVGTVLFLASDDAAFVTGQNILVNGGSSFS